MQKNRQKNRDWLACTSYPGRGIIVGQTSDRASMVQLYWIMGRSSTSQNRRIVEDSSGGARVIVADSTAGRSTENTGLIFYRPMGVVSVPGLRQSSVHVVSNGNQTESIVAGLFNGDSFATVFARCDVEPDGPHFTPRIAGVLTVDDNDSYELAIIKISATDFGQVSFQHFKYRTACAGWGHCITTYEDNGSPLPSFQGEPFLYPLSGTPCQAVHDLWAVLNQDYRVAAIAKFIDRATGTVTVEVINRCYNGNQSSGVRN